MSAELVERGDRLIVSTPYNPSWQEWALDRNGRWDGGSRAWTFKPEQREAVEAAVEEIFGGEK